MFEQQRWDLARKIVPRAAHNGPSLQGRLQRPLELSHPAHHAQDDVASNIHAICVVQRCHWPDQRATEQEAK